jgi:hypothetical protein
LAKALKMEIGAPERQLLRDAMEEEALADTPVERA